jgi:hypothetical protein
LQIRGEEEKINLLEGPDGLVTEKRHAQSCNILLQERISFHRRKMFLLERI